MYGFFSNHPDIVQSQGTVSASEISCRLFSSCSCGAPNDINYVYIYINIYIYLIVIDGKDWIPTFFQWWFTFPSIWGWLYIHTHTYVCIYIYTYLRVCMYPIVKKCHIVILTIVIVMSVYSHCIPLSNRPIVKYDLPTSDTTRKGKKQSPNRLQLGSSHHIMISYMFPIVHCQLMIIGKFQLFP